MHPFGVQQEEEERALRGRAGEGVGRRRAPREQDSPDPIGRPPALRLMEKKRRRASLRAKMTLA